MVQFFFNKYLNYLGILLHLNLILRNSINLLPTRKRPLGLDFYPNNCLGKIGNHPSLSNTGIKLLCPPPFTTPHIVTRTASSKIIGSWVWKTFWTQLLHPISIYQTYPHPLPDSEFANAPLPQLQVFFPGSHSQWFQVE